MSILKELLVRFRGDSTQFEASTDRARKSVSGFQKQTTAASVSIQRSMGAIARAAAPIIAAYAGLNTIRVTEEFRLLAERIRGATRDTQEFNQAFEDLRKTSDSTGANFQSTVDIFQRISFVRDEINATVEDMTQFTDTVSKLGIVSGASTGALNAGLTQLGQGLSSGILRAEEFNSILENIPQVGVAIADEFGVTTGQLRQLVIAGEVLSEDVFNAILNKTQEVNSEFEKFPQTMDRAFNAARNGLMATLAGLNENTNATGVFIQGIVRGGRVIESLINLVSGYAKVIEGLFEVIVAGITDAFIKAMQLIQGAINLSIKGINLLRKEGEKLQKVNFGLDGVDVSDVGIDELRQNAQAAGEAFKAAAEDAMAALMPFNDNIKASSESVRELSKDYEGLVGNVSEASEAAKKASDTTTRGLSNQRRELQLVRSDMTSLFEAGLDGWDSLRSAAVNALKDIANNMLRLSIGGSASSGLFGSIATSLVGGISGMFGPSLSQGAVDLASQGPFNFNTGGSFTVKGNNGIDRNLLSLNGQPIANVSKGETIGVSRAGGSDGVVINQTLNFSTGVQQTVRAEVMGLMPQIAAQSVQAVEGARRRGITS